MICPYTSKVAFLTQFCLHFRLTRFVLSWFLFRGIVRNGIPRVCFYFVSMEFRFVFSSAEWFRTEFREFSVPGNSRNFVGNNHLFRLFRLPRNYFSVGNSKRFFLLTTQNYEDFLVAFDRRDEKRFKIVNHTKVSNCKTSGRQTLKSSEILYILERSHAPLQKQKKEDLELLS
jgi:hypothetical protein